MRNAVAARLLVPVALASAGGCSFFTDFDDFEVGDTRTCEGVETGPCEVAVPRDDGTCEVRQAPAGRACASAAGGCYVGAGTCDAAGVCVGAPAMEGLACDGEFATCDEGRCDGAGSCVARPKPAGEACDPGAAVCTSPVCDGMGGCGAPAFEPFDACEDAVPLFTDTAPGPKEPRSAQCLTHTRDGLCGPRGAPEAFFTVSLPVPRWLQVGVRRPGGGAIGVAGAVSFADSCDPAEAFACTTFGEGPFDGPLIPGDYRVQVDVAAAAGGDLPPAFEVLTLVDPQDRCPTAPLLTVPERGAEPRLFDASNVGAADDFDTNGGGGGDHVYELEVARSGRVVIETFPVPDDQLAEGEENIGDSVLAIYRDCSDAEAPIAFDDDGGDGLYSQLAVDLDAGRYFLVVDGFGESNRGTYSLSISAPEGHLVLIGHDYFATNADANRVLVNAVGLTPRNDPVVAAYAATADTAERAAEVGFGPFPEPDGEPGVADGVITDGLDAQGRLVLINRFTEDDLATLDRVTSDADVLMVYEQEGGLTDGAARVRAAITRFVTRGGVAVVMDAFGGTAPLADGANLLDTGFDPPTTPSTPSRSPTGGTVRVVDRTDPIAAGVSTTYTGPDATSAYYELTGGNTVVEATVSVFDPVSGTTRQVDAPVVVHRTYP